MMIKRQIIQYLTSKKFYSVLLFFCLLLNQSVINAQENQKLVVKANQVKGAVQPTMWGVFFEDINLGADGGIYAELVKNRSFEFYMPMMGWTTTQSKFKEGS